MKEIARVAEQLDKLGRLEGEVQRQESLIDAYQDDNQKLYNTVKNMEVR